MTERDLSAADLAALKAAAEKYPGTWWAFCVLCAKDLAMTHGGEVLRLVAEVERLRELYKPLWQCDACDLWTRCLPVAGDDERAIGPECPSCGCEMEPVYDPTNYPPERNAERFVTGGDEAKGGGA